jgi:hypothetical protein
MDNLVIVLDEISVQIIKTHVEPLFGVQGNDWIGKFKTNPRKFNGLNIFLV